MKKLFLLDAMALIYRAHFAFIRSPRINSKGVNTSAVFGFTNSLLDILNNEKPTHIGIVYDTDTPTFRHEEFESYKANRQSRPEDITIAIPHIYQLADAFRIPNVFVDGFEADDVIGTLAKRAAREGFEVFMMTPDKDYGQLVEEHIFQYKPSLAGKPAETLGVKEICDRWGIENPDQVRDILGLMGDAVDNIPGVPGVGEKTAQKLIQEFGSLENLLANTDKVKGKLRDNLETFKDQAIQSKRLATIHIECPCEFDEHKLIIEEIDRDKIIELFDELEFRQLKSRLLGIETPKNQPADTHNASTDARASISHTDLFSVMSGESLPAASSGEQSVDNTAFLTIDEVPHTYHFCNTPSQHADLLDTLRKASSYAFDTETSSLDPITADMVGFSISVAAGEAWYVPIPQDRTEAAAILDPFREIFADPAREMIGQNAKFDIEVLKQYGYQVNNSIFDTMLAHYLYEPEKRHGMDILARTYLNYAPVSIETLIGKKGKGQITMADIDPAKISDYACEDADVTFQLKDVLLPMLRDVGAEQLLRTVECPLIDVLADMEMAGIRLDVDALKIISTELARDLEELEARVYDLAGIKFNINSPSQMGEILFVKLELDPKAKKTSKTKKFATGEDVLSLLAEKHPIARAILDYRSLQKLKSTYVDSLPLLISPRTGRIHTTYNQAVAATGRLSSTDPNLQNIPIRTERGREIRKAFIPADKDHVILSADYSQIELRLIAEISQEENMLQAFNDGIDIHTATAARMYKIPVTEVSSEMRRRAKTVNFGIIYGISAFGLAQRLGIPRTEASNLIKQYNEQYPRILLYLKEQVIYAREHGFVQTLLGRRRYLRDINSANQTQRGFAERNAINAPIQGSAADMIKLAMIAVHTEMKKRNMKSKMILQVHDELVFDAFIPELLELETMVKEKMCSALPGLKIPIEVETGHGANWLEAH